MGKIFGISNLPVTTIGETIEFPNDIVKKVYPIDLPKKAQSQAFSKDYFEKVNKNKITVSKAKGD